MKALTQYGQDIGSAEFGNYLNRLASIAGIGQSATNQVGAYGSQYGAQVGQNLNNAGNARASGYINQANAYANGMQGVGNAFGQIAGYYANRPASTPSYGGSSTNYNYMYNPQASDSGGTSGGFWTWS